jgi:GntR family transcriptional regulator/MocR family aminotransferase
VIYVGTASKVLFPALRIGWLVVPPDLVEVFRSAKAIADTGTATLEQLAFADFVREGVLERHVRRIRRQHAARRETLLRAVDEELSDRATVVGTSAGIHVLLRIETLAAREIGRLRNACRARDVGIYSAAHYYARPPEHVELLLGYAALGDDDIRSGIRKLREALDEVGGVAG